MDIHQYQSSMYTNKLMVVWRVLSNEFYHKFDTFATQ